MKGTNYMKTKATTKHIAKRPGKLKEKLGTPTKQPKLVPQSNPRGKAFISGE